MCTISIVSQSLFGRGILRHLRFATHAMYATTSAWQPQPRDPHRTEPRTLHFDLRDRVNIYTARDAIEIPPSYNHPSPTDAFFGGGPNTFANQKVARPAIACRPQKHRQSQSEPEKPHIQQEQRLALTNLQINPSPLARGFIDRVVTKSDSIYGDALSKLGDLHQELSKIIAETDAEDERILKFLEDNHRKIIKPPSGTCIRDARTEGEIQLGERVIAVKDRIDTVEAEVASLWDQWENAQKKVDDIFAELASDRRIEEVQISSVTGVQESLAGEMTKFEEELTGILEDAHEEARASEKSFSKKINGIMSDLLQQYLLED